MPKTELLLRKLKWVLSLPNDYESDIQGNLLMFFTAKIDWTRKFERPTAAHQVP